MAGAPAVEAWVSSLKQRVQQAADPSKAAGIRAYMKTQLPVLGVSVPTLRSAVRTHLAQCTPAPPSDPQWLLAAVWMLWDCGNWTFRSAALELAALRIGELGEEPEATLDVLERCLYQCEGWAHLDQLATGPLSVILRQHPAEQSRVDAWRAAKSKWVRRAALLWQIPELRKGAGDLSLLAEIARQYKDDKDFFIQKAIGWTFREAAKGHRDWVLQYVAENEEMMSALAKREALKNVGGYRQSKKLKAAAPADEEDGEPVHEQEEEKVGNCEFPPTPVRKGKAVKRRRTSS